MYTCHGSHTKVIWDINFMHVLFDSGYLYKLQSNTKYENTIDTKCKQAIDMLVKKHGLHVGHKCIGAVVAINKIRVI